MLSAKQARFSSGDEVKKFTLVSLGIAVACWLVAGISLAIFGEKGFEDLSQEIVGRKLIEFQTKAEDIEADQIKNVEELEVIFPQATIEILPSDDEGFHVQYPGTDKEALHGRIDGKRIRYDLARYYEGTESKIVVRLFNGNGFIHLGDSGSSKLTFRIPKNIKKIKARSETGDLKIDSINAAQVKFESTSGSMKIRRMNLSKLEASTTSGDLRFQGYTQNADLKTISGEVKVHSENKSPTMVLATTSGDVNVDFEEEPNVKFSYETTSGELTLKADSDLKEIKRKDMVKLGPAEGDVKVKTVSGDIRVRTLTSF